MDPIVIAAVAELLKLTVNAYAAYMRQAGLTEEQIEAVFQEAKAGMLERDPANLP